MIKTIMTSKSSFTYSERNSNHYEWPIIKPSV